MFTRYSRVVYRKNRVVKGGLVGGGEEREKAGLKKLPLIDIESTFGSMPQKRAELLLRRLFGGYLRMKSW